MNKDSLTHDTVRFPQCKRGVADWANNEKARSHAISREMMGVTSSVSANDLMDF